MSVNVSDMKSQFADLKYEQMIGEKYFIETCFSKKYESISPKQRLQDLLFKIKAKSCVHKTSCTCCA